MKIINLPFISRLKKNLKATPQFIQVVLGPRQVGKTTTILHYLNQELKEKDYLYVSAEKHLTPDSDWILQHWQLARADKKLLVIDEIQKIDNWAEIVKKLWDEEKRRPNPIKCILLGSSSLKIQKGLTESLAGRYQLVPAHHWNFNESHESYKIKFDEFVKFGGYPGSYPLISQQPEWVNYVKHSIVEAVIDRDILSVHTVKSPALFKQAFELLISYPAQEISFTKLLGQLQDKGNTDLIKYYLTLYEGAYLIKALEKYSTKPLKRKSSSPKILPLCPAFYFLTIQGELSLEEKGRAFELIVGSQLCRLEGELFYWREKGNEVDFVFKQGKKLYAIEVKSGRKKTNSGMNAFLAKFPNATPIIITPENYQRFESDSVSLLESIS